MNLREGVRLCVLPRFRRGLLSAEMIQLNGGVEAIGGFFFPTPEWRSPNSDELATLLEEGNQTRENQGIGCSSIGIFEIPCRLRDLWWGAQDEICSTSSCEAAGSSPKHQRFVAASLDYLRFKGISLLPGSRFDTVVSLPGGIPNGHSIPDKPRGLSVIGEDNSRACDLTYWVNLGDEPVSLVFINLPIAEMQTMCGTVATAVTNHDVARRFMATFPEYPVIRLLLAAGQGCCLPADEVVHDGYTKDNTEAQVLLRICRSTADLLRAQTLTS